jgi:hypothetical protein
MCDGTPGDTFHYELVGLQPNSKRNLNCVARDEHKPTVAILEV